MIFASLRGIRLAWIPGDLVAGAMLAAIAIPEQIATARLAGMPAQMGLYAFAAGSLAFAVFGANRYLSVGADSTIAPIFAGAVAAMAVAGSALYPALVVVAALFTGLALVLAGVLRAGWIADLLSIPVTTGFLAGIAVRIVIGQLPAVLGLPDESGTLLNRMVTLGHELNRVSGVTLAIGGSVLILTIAAERISRRVPGALLGLAGAACAVGVLHLRDRGVALLGALPATLPHIGLVFVNAHDALQLIPVALIVALVCMVQSSVVLQSYPSNPGAPVDPSRDFAAVGVGSIASALLGSFAVDASPPRTAIAASSGGRSQISGIVAVAAIALLVVIGGRLTAYLPLAALGGVLIFIAIRIVRVHDILRIARLGGPEIWLVVAGALLVIVLPIETGMLLAIGLSLAHGIYMVARPPSTELVRVPGTTIWWPPDGSSAERIPGVLVFALAAPITFTNVRYIVERLRALLVTTPQPLKLVVLEGSGVSYVDYTGAQFLCEEITKLRANGVTVAIARLSDQRARNAATRSGLIAAIGENRTFDSVHEALETLDPGVT